MMIRLSVVPHSPLVVVVAAGRRDGRWLSPRPPVMPPRPPVYRPGLRFVAATGRCDYRQ